MNLITLIHPALNQRRPLALIHLLLLFLLLSTRVDGAQEGDFLYQLEGGLRSAFGWEHADHESSMT
jgi:hypothetical protein